MQKGDDMNKMSVRDTANSEFPDLMRALISFLFTNLLNTVELNTLIMVKSFI